MVKSLKDGITTFKGTVLLNTNFLSYYKNGQNYCYPFRDYFQIENYLKKLKN